MANGFESAYEIVVEYLRNKRQGIEIPIHKSQNYLIARKRIYEERAENGEMPIVKERCRRKAMELGAKIKINEDAATIVQFTEIAKKDLSQLLNNELVYGRANPEEHQIGLHAEFSVLADYALVRQKVVFAQLNQIRAERSKETDPDKQWYLDRKIRVYEKHLGVLKQATIVFEKEVSTDCPIDSTH